MLTNVISPLHESISYETLWNLPDISFKRIADLFRGTCALPSQVLEEQTSHNLFLEDLREEIAEFFVDIAGGVGISIHGDFDYPRRLRDATNPIELFYYFGDIGLTTTRCVSIVGAREASQDGKARAERLAKLLVEAGFTIVSGLAKGIDTAAMTAAIDAGGQTIGVIGTPLTETYPKENTKLQADIAERHLLVSQVPFYRYQRQHWKSKSLYFPERNATMAAISEATVIVEASDTSGTLTQARACMQQGRKLFILNSCFENKSITWPTTYEKRGAIRVRTIEDILGVLGTVDDTTKPVEED